MQRRPRVALLEWLDPPFSCGHWSPELVRLAGGIEGLGHEGRPSRTLRWDEVLAWQPEIVFIACCGFSVERTLCDLPSLQFVPGWQDVPAVRSGRVYVTNGSHYFSRPGPRLVDSLEILAHTLHPDVHPLPAGLPPPVRVNHSELVNRASGVFA
jgi:iron complex transport system substrate-binding protein